MRKKYKFILPTLLAVFLFCCLFSATIKNRTLSTASTPILSKKIIIDAGHGGFDGGAVADDGTSEKDINLSIALSVGEMLSTGGYEVIYTRMIDTGAEDNSNASISKRKVSDLNNRLKIIEEHPDAIFVSIHLNKFTATSANGAQVFYSANNIKSQDLGVSIQKSIVNLLQKNNKRVVKKSDSSTFLLKNATVPAVIVECGFVSNVKELELLKDKSYQQQMAFAVYCGIEDYMINEV